MGGVWVGFTLGDGMSLSIEQIADNFKSLSDAALQVSGAGQGNPDSAGNGAYVALQGNLVGDPYQEILEEGLSWWELTCNSPSSIRCAAMAGEAMGCYRAFLIRFRENNVLYNPYCLKVYLAGFRLEFICQGLNASNFNTHKAEALVLIQLAYVDLSKAIQHLLSSGSQGVPMLTTLWVGLQKGFAPFLGSNAAITSGDVDQLLRVVSEQSGEGLMYEFPSIAAQF